MKSDVKEITKASKGKRQKSRIISNYTYSRCFKALVNYARKRAEKHLFCALNEVCSVDARFLHIKGNSLSPTFWGSLSVCLCVKGPTALKQIETLAACVFESPTNLFSIKSKRSRIWLASHGQIPGTERFHEPTDNVTYDSGISPRSRRLTSQRFDYLLLLAGLMKLHTAFFCLFYLLLEPVESHPAGQ